MDVLERRYHQKPIYRLSLNALLHYLSLFEPRLDDKHHDHMICIDTGDIIEFYNEKLENLQDEIAEKHGYEVVRHVHQLFVRPKK